MFSIDGKPVDLTKPETLKGITILPGGSITQKKDNVVMQLKNQTSQPVQPVQPANN